MRICLCSASYGAHRAAQVLRAVDKEGHNALDWAADSGSINVIEYLVRRGLDPYRVDSSNRGPLFWAVKAHRLAAARFLVQCGCDPHHSDSSGVSPMQLALSKADREMLRALDEGSSCHSGSCCPCGGQGLHTVGPQPIVPSSAVSSTSGSLLAGPEEAVAAGSLAPPEIHIASMSQLIREFKYEPGSVNSEPRGAEIVSFSVRGYTAAGAAAGGGAVSLRRSFAVTRINKSRPSYALGYCVIVCLFWFFTTCLPFYVWILATTVLFLVYR